VVSSSVRENRLRVNRSESVDASLGFLAARRSCRVGDSRGGRVGRRISDRGGEDRLESLIFGIVLIVLMNLIVILITNEFNDDINDNINYKRQEKQVENSNTGALAVTRDYPDTIPGYYPNCPDSHDISKDTDIPDTIRGYYPETGICGEHCLE
jgi:hypothetical protein